MVAAQDRRTLLRRNAESVRAAAEAWRRVSSPSEATPRVPPNLQENQRFVPLNLVVATRGGS